MSLDKLNKNGVSSLWERIWTLIQLVTGNVDVTNKGDLQTQVDTLSDTVSDCFTNVSNGKSLVASAITDKGVSTDSDATFATMADNIGKIKSNPTLQSKSAALHTGQTSVTMKPDSGYDGLSQATAAITLQEKTAALSTAAQSITPDSGKVLSKVTVPAVTGTAGTGDVLSGKTFSSAAGVNKTGAMANQGAWTGATSGSGNVAIPAGYHNGNGYVSGAGAYNAGYSNGVTDADNRANANSVNYQSGYNQGVANTKVGNAGTGDVLSGKTFTNASTVGATGAMPNKGGTTVDAGSTTQDSTYTYLGIPSSGYYSSGSKVRAKNSDLITSKSEKTVTLSSAGTVSIKPNWREVIIVYTSNSYNTIAYIDSSENIINPIPAYMRFTVSEINRSAGTVKLTAGSYRIFYE